MDLSRDKMSEIIQGLQVSASHPCDVSVSLLPWFIGAESGLLGCLRGIVVVVGSGGLVGCSIVTHVKRCAFILVCCVGVLLGVCVCVCFSHIFTHYSRE